MMPSDPVPPDSAPPGSGGSSDLPPAGSGPPSARPGNIGPGGIRLRQGLGVAGVAGGVAVVGALLALDAGRWWRLMAALPFWVGLLGLLQAKEKT